MSKIKFVGQYSELKKFGFDFSYMFANRYQCWIFDDIYIWKKDNDVEIKAFTNFEEIALKTLISYFKKENFSIELLFEEENKQKKSLLVKKEKGDFLMFYYNNKTNIFTNDKTEYFKQETSLMKLLVEDENNVLPNREWQQIFTPVMSIEMLYFLYKNGLIILEN